MSEDSRILSIPPATELCCFLIGTAEDDDDLAESDDDNYCDEVDCDDCDNNDLGSSESRRNDEPSEAHSESDAGYKEKEPLYGANVDTVSCMGEGPHSLSLGLTVAHYKADTTPQISRKDSVCDGSNESSSITTTKTEYGSADSVFSYAWPGKIECSAEVKLEDESLSVVGKALPIPDSSDSVVNSSESEIVSSTVQTSDCSSGFAQTVISHESSHSGVHQLSQPEFTIHVSSAGQQTQQRVTSPLTAHSHNQFAASMSTSHSSVWPLAVTAAATSPPAQAKPASMSPSSSFTLPEDVTKETVYVSTCHPTTITTPVEYSVLQRTVTSPVTSSSSATSLLKRHHSVGQNAITFRSEFRNSGTITGYGQGDKESLGYHSVVDLSIASSNPEMKEDPVNKRMPYNVRVSQDQPKLASSQPPVENTHVIHNHHTVCKIISTDSEKVIDHSFRSWPLPKISLDKDVIFRDARLCVSRQEALAVEYRVPCMLSEKAKIHVHVSCNSENLLECPRDPRVRFSADNAKVPETVVLSDDSHNSVMEEVITCGDGTRVMTPERYRDTAVSAEKVGVTCDSMSCEDSVSDIGHQSPTDAQSISSRSVDTSLKQVLAIDPHNTPNKTMDTLVNHGTKEAYQKQRENTMFASVHKAEDHRRIILKDTPVSAKVKFGDKTHKTKLNSDNKDKHRRHMKSVTKKHLVASRTRKDVYSEMRYNKIGSLETKNALVDRKNKDQVKGQAMDTGDVGKLKEHTMKGESGDHGNCHGSICHTDDAVQLKNIQEEGEQTISKAAMTTAPGDKEQSAETTALLKQSGNLKHMKSDNAKSVIKDRSCTSHGSFGSISNNNVSPVERKWGKKIHEKPNLVFKSTIEMRKRSQEKDDIITDCKKRKVSSAGAEKTGSLVPNKKAVENGDAKNHLSKNTDPCSLQVSACSLSMKLMKVNAENERNQLEIKEHYKRSLSIDTDVGNLNKGVVQISALKRKLSLNNDNQHQAAKKKKSVAQMKEVSFAKAVRPTSNISKVTVCSKSPSHFINKRNSNEQRHKMPDSACTKTAVPEAHDSKSSCCERQRKADPEVVASMSNGFSAKGVQNPAKQLKKRKSAKICATEKTITTRFCSECIVNPSRQKQNEQTKRKTKTECASCSKQLWSKPNRCPRCELDLPNALALYAHAVNNAAGLQVKDGVRYCCLCCDKRFNLRLEFYRHVAFSSCSRFCVSCEKLFDSNETKVKHSCKSSGIGTSGQELTVIDNQHSLQCYICKTAKENATEMELHMMEHKTAARSFNCEKCGASFYTRQSFEKHSEFHNHLEALGKYPKSTENETLQHLELQCFKCKACFHSKVDLAKHIKERKLKACVQSYPEVDNSKQSNNSLLSKRCFHCKETFSSQKALEMHIEKRESGLGCNSNARLRCFNCHAKFDTHQDLKLHISDRDTGKGCTCVESSLAKKGIRSRKMAAEDIKDVQKGSEDAIARSKNLLSSPVKKDVAPLGTQQEHPSISGGSSRRLGKTSETARYRCHRCYAIFDKFKGLKMHIKKRKLGKGCICREPREKSAEGTLLTGDQETNTDVTERTKGIPSGLMGEIATSRGMNAVQQDCSNNGSSSKIQETSEMLSSEESLSNSCTKFSTRDMNLHDGNKTSKPCKLETQKENSIANIVKDGNKTSKPCKLETQKENSIANIVKDVNIITNCVLNENCGDKDNKSAEFTDVIGNLGVHSSVEVQSSNGSDLNFHSDFKSCPYALNKQRCMTMESTKSELGNENLCQISFRKDEGFTKTSALCMQIDMAGGNKRDAPCNKIKPFTEANNIKTMGKCPKRKKCEVKFNPRDSGVRTKDGNVFGTSIEVPVVDKTTTVRSREVKGLHSWEVINQSEQDLGSLPVNVSSSETHDLSAINESADYSHSESRNIHTSSFLSKSKNQSRPTGSNSSDTERKSKVKNVVQTDKLTSTESSFKSKAVTYKPLSCWSCGEDQISLCTLDNHLADVHNMKRKYFCRTSGCNVSFVLERSLENHRLEQHQHARRKCDYTCGSYRRLDEHLMTEHGHSSHHYCKSCHVSFTSKRELERHKEEVHQQWTPLRTGADPVKAVHHAADAQRNVVSSGFSDYSEREYGHPAHSYRELKMDNNEMDWNWHVSTSGLFTDGYNTLSSVACTVCPEAREDPSFLQWDATSAWDHYSYNAQTRYSYPTRSSLDYSYI